MIHLFDFVLHPAHHGPWARLQDESGREVTITDWPTSLIQMLLAGVLVGAAKDTAEALRAAMEPTALARLERGAAANIAAGGRPVIERPTAAASVPPATAPRPKPRTRSRAA